MTARYIIGVDEVGRGSLAGPVTVAAVCVPEKFKIKYSKRGELKDSKKLSAANRAQWFNYFKNEPKIKYRLGWVYPATIDRINISRAANRAAWSAFVRLANKYRIGAASRDIFLDGGLYLGDRRGFPRAKTVVRGDEKFIAVKIASIIAKVSRDKGMARLSKKYPQYGFEIHKGYGTKKHVAAIRKYGRSEAHRLTFIKKHPNI